MWVAFRLVKVHNTDVILEIDVSFSLSLVGMFDGGSRSRDSVMTWPGLGMNDSMLPRSGILLPRQYACSNTVTDYGRVIATIKEWLRRPWCNVATLHYQLDRLPHWALFRPARPRTASFPEASSYQIRRISDDKAPQTSHFSNEDLKISKIFDVSHITAVVMGGGTGIGLMIAQTLHTNGAKVYITGRRQGALDKVVEQYGSGQDKRRQCEANALKAVQDRIISRWSSSREQEIIENLLMVNWTGGICKLKGLRKWHWRKVQSSSSGHWSRCLPTE